MRILAILLFASVSGLSCSRWTDDFQPEIIVALERGALDRWGRATRRGTFHIMASDLTYFDPMTPKRIDGLDALKKYIAPFPLFTDIARKLGTDRSRCPRIHPSPRFSQNLCDTPDTL